MMAEERPPSNGTDTSLAAAISVAEDASGMRARILDLLRAHPKGMTTDEIEVALNMRHQTASARMWELAKQGLIGDSGDRRQTRSRRMARVYKSISNKELAALSEEAAHITQEIIANTDRALRELLLVQGKKGDPQ